MTEKRKFIPQGVYILLVIVMVFIDAFIKVIIDHFFMEQKFLINDKFGFTPYLNQSQLSIFNNEMRLNVNLNVLIALNIVGIIALVVAESRFQQKRDWTKALDIAVKICLVGAICSLIDKIFWAGSLDYILLYSKIVDLKDLYMFGALCICIVEGFRQIGESIKDMITRNMREKSK